jgi:hypothetical protein
MHNRDQKIRVVLALLLTLAVLQFVANRLLALIVLLGVWSVIFYPLAIGEIVLFLVAALFFVVQDYLSLKAGLFAFRDKDMLLMPFYEPALWGFYFLGMKRFVTGTGTASLVVDWKAIVGVVVSSLVFSLFSDSHTLFIATLCLTAFLFFLFHTKTDISYALYALVLGFVIEIFGVSKGLWSYPAPDFLGIPFWFATMWVSVGLLGRRFLIPATEWLAAKLARQRA